jgi:hypothetical protein
LWSAEQGKKFKEINDMRSVRWWVYSLLAVVGLWQSLVSVSPATAADEIKFFATNNSDTWWYVTCDGPWFRTSGSFNKIDAFASDHNFYTAEVNLFSPYGQWECRYGGEGTIVSTVKFCLASGAPEVKVTIPEKSGGGLSVEAEFCDARSLPPPVLTQLQGSATKVGNSHGPSTVSLFGKFILTEPLALDLATVTIDALLNEVEGADELVAGLPLVLTAKSGSTANAATYQSVPNTLPRVRLDITKSSSETKPVEFRLKVEDTTIAQYPQRCSPGSKSTTALALRFTIDDGVNLPFVVESEVAWACLGSNPQMPSALKVQGLLPIEPVSSTPEGERM